MSDAKKTNKFWFYNKYKKDKSNQQELEKTKTQTTTSTQIDNNDENKLIETETPPKTSLKTTTTSKSTKKPTKIFVNQIVKTNLMTEFEQKMYECLCNALPKSVIFPQVSFNSLIQENEEINAWEVKSGIRNKFNRKVVDFVIYDKDIHQVLAIVELDDPSHLSTKQIQIDKERDQMLRQAGYFVLRFTEIPEFGEIIKKMRAIRTLSELNN